ncbi:hypothetical protein HHL11_11375 [Ramlibacter sp. G-1-2-2]|uniref:DUF7673 domain-containing protein n=1 Tax=Ramlibacter agri TaxID=2728837 RepID=A0A848H0M1_9BURK|nr:hypothetical protein [Ramlibacter agri]NML44355.1 hypothetical protein [Ramlibacter agri]
MTQAERERRHHASLEHINHVRLVVGRGDRLRIDHEGTLLERARLLSEEMASHLATERGLAAFDRLLRIAEEAGAPQAADIVAFVAAVTEGEPLQMATLRGVDAAVGEDMLAVLDAFRYARVSLASQVEGGAARVCRLLRQR